MAQHFISNEIQEMSGPIESLAQAKIEVGRDIINVFNGGFDDLGNMTISDPFILSGCCLVADVLEENYK